MILITLIANLLAIPLSSSASSSGSTLSSTLLTRMTSITLLYAAILAYIPSGMDTGTYVGLDAGLGLFSGLIHATTLTQGMEVFLFAMGALILLPWASSNAKGGSATPTIPEYSLIILFTTMGASILLATADLVSLYLAIELQSFGVYILAALYRDSESATAAGLKYFLLGALSSALILLGSGLVYGYTGLTNLDSIYELVSVPSRLGGPDSYSQGVALGLLIITIGLLFKVASAPFHYWAPDVYDGTPTIVTTWLTIMPKISIFILLLELYRGTGQALDVNYIAGLGGETAQLVTAKNILLVCSFLSLVIGTVVGLSQYRIKRLFAYSTISHVGFLLLALALAVNAEESVESFLFYIVQYSLTNLDAFAVVLAFGYLSKQALQANSQLGLRSNSSPARLETNSADLQYISELKGQFRSNPILGLSLAICLFSMAGIPPMVGFFAKYTVLYTAVHNGYYFLAVVGILASVVSAVYYLRFIRVIHFDLPESDHIDTAAVAPMTLTSVHSYIVAVLTLFVMLFAANPNLILNSTYLMALSLYTT